MSRVSRNQMRNTIDSSDAPSPVATPSGGPEDPVPVGEIKQARNWTYSPVTRRPPELPIEPPLENDLAIFQSLIKAHVSRVSATNTDTFTNATAELLMRRVEQARESGVPPAAERGLDILSETLRMIEHLYVAQSGGGGA